MAIRIVEDIFGSAIDPFTKENTPIKRFTFINDDNQMSVQVITLGATITTLKVPDQCGKIDDIVCGFDDVEGYQSSTNPYFGATIGRVCNRLGFGKFQLNGQEYHVTKNYQNKHQLHGGLIGFDKVHWSSEKINNNTVIMNHVSLDGHEGYPGQLTVTVQFQLTIDNCFHVQFTAITDKPTIVNLTNHSYFNLAGHNTGSEEIYNHLVKIKANQITITDADSIPTGDLADVNDTDYDLRTLDYLGVRMKRLLKLGFDDNYCIDMNKNESNTVIAKVSHPKSGRWMEIISDQPGVQFYTSNNMPDPIQHQIPINGKENAKYLKHGAICFETQKYPDAINHANFPTIQLNPGETYHHNVTYKFGVCKSDRMTCQHSKKK